MPDSNRRPTESKYPHSTPLATQNDDAQIVHPRCAGKDREEKAASEP